MPVDRVIAVNITGEDTYNQAGQFVPGESVTYRRYASLLDTSLARQLESGGARQIEEQIFRVRWFSVLANASVTEVSVVDLEGLTHTVTGIEEPTGRDARDRRRWLDLTVTREGR